MVHALIRVRPQVPYVARSVVKTVVLVKQMKIAS